MKRFIYAFSIVCGLLMITLPGQPAEAGKMLSNDDLKGEYIFSITEVRRTLLPGGTSALTHCEIAGTANFDGVGLVTIDGMSRCVTAGILEAGAITGTEYYFVNPDGSFLISESPGMTDPDHGQIVDRGRSLLMDGTMRTSNEVLSRSGIGMRR